MDYDYETEQKEKEKKRKGDLNWDQARSNGLKIMSETRDKKDMSPRKYFLVADTH